MEDTLWANDLSYMVVVFQDMADSFNALELRDGNNTDGGRERGREGRHNVLFSLSRVRRRCCNSSKHRKTKLQTGDF